MLIRIDDYPNGVRSNDYWSGSSCGFNDDWQEHTFQLNLVLREFEQRQLPYILGVVPTLLEERDIEYLKSLQYCEVALHGYDHGCVMFKQVRPSQGAGRSIHGGWTGVDNEFHPRFRKSKEQITREFSKGLDMLKDFDVNHFIPPFNHMTQDAIDVVKDCGLTDIWKATPYLETNLQAVPHLVGLDYHDLKVHDPGHCGRSHEMPVDINLDRNTIFHLTWELEEFKKNMNSWKLPKILDYIMGHYEASEPDGPLAPLR